MKAQRYVSDELTHFVGRDVMADATDTERESREEQLYARLLSILREGQLKTGGKETGVNADPSIGKEGITVERVISYEVGSKSLQKMFDPAVICFCDIPVEDIGIHVAKYSPFGLAFSRHFLLEEGTNPVLYLAEDAMVGEGAGTLGSLFIEEMNRALHLLSELQVAHSHPAGAPRFQGVQGLPHAVTHDATLIHQFLLIHVFAFVKAFRADSADEDPENYYMEREWRRYGDLDFTLDDVCRVYLPRRFAKRLRADLPEYYGQVTFVTEARS